MPARILLFVLCALIALPCAFSQNPQNEPKQEARNDLNQGVADYKASRFDEAIEHFKRVTELDPELVVGHLYLATAYAQQYVPDVDTPDNVKNATLAIEQYQIVLKKDPANSNSLLGTAYLLMSMKKFDEAREYYKKAIDADPNNPETYYSVGVIDWRSAYKDISDRKAKIGLKVDDELKWPRHQRFCEEIRNSNLASIEEGIAMLQQAMKLRADYDDAMAYVNLLYRRKADTECNNPKAQAADLAAADHWVDLAMAARKKKAEQGSAKGPTNR
jgi:tetratricopeptide (TPR) repeat protein